MNGPFSDLVQDICFSYKINKIRKFIIPIYLFRSKGIRILFYYRISNYLISNGFRFFAGYFYRRACNLGADINPSALLCPGVSIPHPMCIVIGHGVLVGARAKILQGVTIGGASGKRRSDGSSQPRIGDDVVIGAGAKLLGPIDIGDRVRIGANSVVVKDVKSDSVIAGVPARYITKVNPNVE